MNKSVIYIDKQGNLCGLACDLLDRLHLGKKRISRISSVEYNHTRELWVAIDLDTGKEIAAHKVRSLTIEAEKKFFNKRLEEQFAKA